MSFTHLHTSRQTYLFWIRLKTTFKLSVSKSVSTTFSSYQGLSKWSKPGIENLNVCQETHAHTHKIKTKPIPKDLCCCNGIKAHTQAMSSQFPSLLQSGSNAEMVLLKSIEGWWFSRSQGVLRLSSIIVKYHFLLLWEHNWRSPSFEKYTLENSKMG